MNACLAVALTTDGYEFTACRIPSHIHVFAVDDIAGIPSVTMNHSQQAKTLLAQLGIEDLVVTTPLDGPGEIGMPVEHLDRFLDGAHRSPYSVTVTEEVKAYIEEK